MKMEYGIYLHAKYYKKVKKKKTPAITDIVTQKLFS